MITNSKILVFLVALGLAHCQQDLSGQAREKKEKDDKKSEASETEEEPEDGLDLPGDGAATDTPTDTATDTATSEETGDEGEDEGEEEGQDEGEDTRVKAELKDAKVIKGGEKCPKGSAAFVADDHSTSDLANLLYVCFPLPKSDVLKSKGPKERKGACEDGEVIVGSASGLKVLCAEIDTDKYDLEAAEPCYYGQGIGGGGQAGKCEGSFPLDIAELKKQQGFLDDGCASKPFGALVVDDLKKTCDQKKFMRLVDKKGDEVEMFK